MWLMNPNEAVKQETRVRGQGKRGPPKRDVGPKLKAQNPHALISKHSPQMQAYQGRDQ